MFSRIAQFLQTDLWRVRLSQIPRAKSFFLRGLRIAVLSLRGFNENRTQLRASALTFYTLLSIVPVFAMLFGIGKGFGLEQAIERQLMEKLSGHEEVARRIVDFSYSLLRDTKGGVMAGIGVVVLFWTIIELLKNIETSFNAIWKTQKLRSLNRRISDYLSVMLICPVLLIVSSSITVLITSQVRFFTQKIALLGSAGPVIFPILSLLPYCMIWILFTFVYIFMPNIKVRLLSGLLGGIIGGTLYQLFQWAYINFQIGVSKYNAIYGSFAALPLFLIWLKYSWLIVLFGAEIAFAHQNVENYEFEPDCSHLSHASRRLLALTITHAIVKNFAAGEKPCTALEVSRQKEIPLSLVRQILGELVNSGILSGTGKGEDDETRYQPALDLEKVTVKFVIDALEKHGRDAIPVGPSEELEKIAASLESMNDAVERSPANQLLKNL